MKNINMVLLFGVIINNVLIIRDGPSHDSFSGVYYYLESHQIFLWILFILMCMIVILIGLIRDLRIEKLDASNEEEIEAKRIKLARAREYWQRGLFWLILILITPFISILYLF